MKKLVVTLSLACACLGTISSCDTYHSLNNATSIGQLAANPFMQGIAKNLVKQMGSMLVQNGVKSIGKIGLNTNLTSLLSTAQAVSSFKGLLTNNYGIAAGLVDRNFSKLSSVRDVVGMIASNGTKGLNFYSF